MKVKGFFTGLLMLWFLCGFISSPVYASTGWCSSSTLNNFNYDFGTKQISDTSQNSAGTVFLDAYTWDLGKNYSIICDCDAGELYAVTYFHTQTDLPLGHSDGTYQYYKVNDYLEVATNIFVSGGRQAYVPTPRDNLSNNMPSSNTRTCNNVDNATTGSKGKLSLYISKPFVGTSTINTKVLDIYGSTISGSFGGSSLVSLYIQGQVIVPQTCSVNAGQIVTVDFGSFMSGEFKNKGQMPAGYTPKTITVPIKCNGMDANASLTLRFQAEASTDEPAAIKTSNDDVGVQITDDSGKVIEPNSGLIPFQLDDNLQATVTFHAAPISTTGNAPAEGTFSATAYIRVDFA